MSTQQSTRAAQATLQVADQQVAMTLAGIAATAATPRPSGESVAEQCTRVILGVNQQLADPGLATQGDWSLLWAALSEDNANMAYLARSTDGSNQFAVVLRGTVGNVTDLLEDLDVGTVVPFTAVGKPADPVYVSKGAMEAFSQVLAMSAAGLTLVEALSAALSAAPANPTVLVIGHSLGGCLATMVAPYLQTLTWPGATAPVFGLYTFAAPTAGGPDFAAYVTGPDLTWVVNERYVNCYDVVPLAWESIDTAKGWYPDKGPAADVDTKAVITALASLPGPNTYVQPGACSQLNPDYDINDSNLQKKSLQDFMGQAAYQHANNTYLGLLNAPLLPMGPQVAGITPDTGGAGTQVTITGTGFDAGAMVDFGPFACTDVTVGEGGTTITATAPEGIGVAAVRVTTCLGTSPAVATAQFAYGGPSPVRVTGITPNSGAAGTLVTITGVNFGSDAKVFFAGVQAPGPNVSPPDTISVDAPKGVTGVGKPSTVNITVVSNGYSSPAGPADEYAYPEL
ncbi:IPT/TIG domain-containing protein [Yinghuangia seranimata]|uniref:IPT/TIG domain-containing protein n=1 Tax=Yinghuangia seranimata TaxID=408067 RepID=UPI00248B2150|nr:IPT/TIG domain-containing protein [Yinghuangia seranimata]MDI2131134.1 IPT/TIG domain-containing protein [Yinghuangia seranimata]